jgi:hypothetical protein
VKARTVASGLAVLTMLAACSQSLPVPRPENLAVPPPAVTAAQSQSIVTSVGDVVAEGDGGLDGAVLETRLTGPALAMRSAEYVRASATEGQKPPTVLPMTQASAVLPQTTTWPRSFLVITDQPDDLSAQRILVLQQDSARDQYKLWGWARLFPGITMPSTAPLDQGSRVLPVDDEDLAMVPQDVLTLYADLLTNGEGSAAAPLFATDPYRSSIEANRAAYADQLGANQATFTETYTPQGPPEAVLATIDGGALLVGQITTTSTATAASGGKLENSDPFAAALAGTAPSTTLSWTYTDIVVFYIPSAAAGGPVVPLAAEHLVTSASAS